MAKTTIIILVLIILLLTAVVYIGYDKYNIYQIQKQITAYQQGAQAGYQQAIIQVMQQASTCQQVPLFANNETITVISISCLQNKT